MVFKLIIDFFHFIGTVFDASGFPVITSYLRFTKSETKWTSVTVWVPLAYSRNLAAGWDNVLLSLGLKTSKFNVVIVSTLHKNSREI